MFLGAVGGPKWADVPVDKRPEAGLLGIRKALGLFANLRPVATIPELIDSSPLKREKLEGVDIMVVRELTGGWGIENQRKGKRRAPWRAITIRARDGVISPRRAKRRSWSSKW